MQFSLHPNYKEPGLVSTYLLNSFNKYIFGSLILGLYCILLSYNLLSSVIKDLALLLLLNHLGALFFYYKPLKLSDLSVLHSDILLPPSQGIIRAAPNLVHVAILSKICVSSDLVLGIERLMAAATILVVTLYLPVLVRVVEIEVSFLVLTQGP